jgi:hypothetical protein
MDNRERFRSVVIAATDPSGALTDPPLQITLQRDVVAAPAARVEAGS